MTSTDETVLSAASGELRDPAGYANKLMEDSGRTPCVVDRAHLGQIDEPTWRWLVDASAEADGKTRGFYFQDREDCPGREAVGWATGPHGEIVRVFVEISATG